MDDSGSSLPPEWKKLKVPNFYSYKEIIVKRIDHKSGEIELVARDFLGKPCRSTAQQLVSAMKKMEERLTVTER